MAKQVLGLGIEYSYSEANKTVPSLRAEFTIKRGISSKTFFTSSALREALIKTGFKEGAQFGKIVIYYESKNKTMQWRQYYPIPRDFTKPLAEFGSKGFAIKLEAIVRKEAILRFPDTKMVTRWKPSLTLQKQLKRRGYTSEQISNGVSVRREAWLLRKALIIGSMKGRLKSGIKNLKNRLRK